MEDERMNDDTDPAPVAAGERASRWLLWLFLAALALGLVLAALWWRTPREDPLATMVSAFQKQNSLTVFQAQVATVVTNRDDRLFGLLPAEQVAVIPATVEYRLDLSRLGPDDFEWDAETQHLQVTLPPITVGKPNLDESRARYVRKGLLVSGETQEALTRQNTQAAADSAMREALNPQLVALARSAAREAMLHNVTLPMRAAGYDQLTVDIRFAGEKGRENDASYLDRSRRIEDVLKERQAAE